MAWFRSGAPGVWLSAGAVSVAVIMTLGLLLLIAIKGLGHFWPAGLLQTTYQVPGQAPVTLVGEVVEQERSPRQRLRDAGLPLSADGDRWVTRMLVKFGNRDLNGTDFTWVVEPWLGERDYPAGLVTLERQEWGNFYGHVVALKEAGKVVAEGPAAWPALQPRLARSAALAAELNRLQTVEVTGINHELERLRLAQRRQALENPQDPGAEADAAAERGALEARLGALETRAENLRQQAARDTVVMADASGRQVELYLSDILHAYQPNAMNVAQKTGVYFARLWEFLSTNPRESNTEGGVFPAIFGTVMMTLLMAVVVTPFGVLAAVYLREYARQGWMTRIIRIAVNNLAGVPAIVYGVFGLGFFVYVLGGSLDRLFFPERLPAPTLGTPGLLWASLTLALLSVPVVIVATEEGLARIPRSLREGSLALGATQAETLWKIVLPMASPAIMTGVILAVARAAGEVALLMLVGVVKLAPSLPVDGNFPYVHLDQKIMHLGFHIYDVGFQSPNVEAARPLVYATALLLVAVIGLLNLSAVAMRNHLREKYRGLDT
ncbi:phosphate ABC transporter permease PstA [Pseudomonas sp. DC3000-4b1]|uniref:phosphate ABC transporter permease PstA n=1 Tax=unclassified Pseudomonas TaxID=196821 RepID=UPI003CFB87B1